MEILIYIFLVLFIITALLLRFYLAPQIYESSVSSLYSVKTQWSPTVETLPNTTCALISSIAPIWPPPSENCMVEGLSLYSEGYKRFCEVGNCINFSGNFVNGSDTFTGMCENSYCGITQCYISFSNYNDVEAYVTVDDATTSSPTLGIGPSGTVFMMRRMGFNSEGSLIPAINGTFAFFYYVDSGGKQFVLNYNNTYAPTGKGSYLPRLNLQASSGFTFPTQLSSNGVTLFVLMENLTADEAGLNNPNIETMRRKILIFYSSNIINDTQLIGSYRSSLITIGERNPQQVFTALATIGAGIVSWLPATDKRVTEQGYYYDVDYNKEMLVASDDIKKIGQDIVEPRLAKGQTALPTGIPFYSWSV